MAFKITDHFLVPEHLILPKEMVDRLLEKLGITLDNLPRVSKTDPIVKEIGAKKGDVIKIVRGSRTAGKAIYYRKVD